VRKIKKSPNLTFVDTTRLWQRVRT